MIQNGKYDFNSKLAVKYIDEKLNELDRLTAIERNFLEVLQKESGFCKCIEEWHFKINIQKGKYQINELSFGWLYDCGNQFEWSLYYIWYAMKMIYKQLLQNKNLDKVFSSEGRYYNSSLYQIS
jgi:hypothetical protein